jgi:hypothetical protein
MGARESLQRLIDKKQAELADLEIQLREGRAYIQALQDSMKIIPRDAGEEQPDLRPHSALAKTRDLIKNSGKPLHIGEILQLLGKPNDKKNRVSISGTLSSYARNHRIFTKTAPNTFGLIELGMNGNGDHLTNELENDNLEELPASFGKL